MFYEIIMQSSKQTTVESSPWPVVIFWMFSYAFISLLIGRSKKFFLLLKLEDNKCAILLSLTLNVEKKSIYSLKTWVN